MIYLSIYLSVYVSILIIRIGIRIDLRIDIRISIRVDLRIDLCIDQFIGIRIDTYVKRTSVCNCSINQSWQPQPSSTPGTPVLLVGQAEIACYLTMCVQR